MEVQAHTTPESRQALRSYLRNRRMTTSIHQTITTQTLNDLEEAIRLLRGVQHPSEAWVEEIEAFLAERASGPNPGMDGRAGNIDVVVPKLLDELLLREDHRCSSSPEVRSPCPSIRGFTGSMSNDSELQARPDDAFKIG